MPDAARKDDEMTAPAGRPPVSQRAPHRRRPVLSLSLDLDNAWSYMKTHGDPGWESHPSYLDALCPIVLDRLARHGLTITVFVVGQDAALPGNRDALASLAAAGHEIGNHSFHHEPWLHRYEDDQIRDEIARAQDAIEAATGERARGFRGPGFSLSRGTLAALADHGFDYDASTLPTFLGPLARAYYFWSSRNLSREERRERGRLFGTVSDGLRPLAPYAWSVGDSSILEIPVTTMPVVRAPFHLSYIGWLATRSRAAASAYLRMALALCRAGRVEPSFLLHPLDFIGADRAPELAFFPGMNMPTDEKLDLFDEVMETLSQRYDVVTMAEHARVVRSRSGSGLRLRSAESLP